MLVVCQNVVKYKSIDHTNYMYDDIVQIDQQNKYINMYYDLRLVL